MKYCADTWFVLSLFGKDQHSRELFQQTREGKTKIVLPLVVFAEGTKKLLQRGVPQMAIDDFFDTVESSEKVELVIPDKRIAREAARISLTFNIPLIDSFVAATSNLTACDVLLTGDSDYETAVKKRYIKIMSW